MTPEELRAFRGYRGWSQKDMAEAVSRYYADMGIEVSRSAILMMEIGARKIQPYVVKFCNECVD